jgi:hypothetical protein
MLDHHHARVCHIDSDLDHRRRDQHVDFACGEAPHHVVLVGSRHPPMDQIDPQAGKGLTTELVGEGRRRLEVALGRLLDERDDDVDLAAAGDLLA